MTQRLALAAVTLFWVVMNYLLWRAEFAGTDDAARPLPAATVWQKMLTAPDSSNLDIFHRKKRVGSLRWAPSVGEGEAPAAKKPGNDFGPEGRVAAPVDYTVDIGDGNLLWGEPALFYRFNFSARFSTSHAWREVSFRLAQKRGSIELRADAVRESLRLRALDEDTEWVREFAFADLRRPEKLLAELAGGSLPATLLMGALGGAAAPARLNDLQFGLRWEARNDWLKAGHSNLRCYRLEARLLDRHRVTVFVSRVGEILRVELPDELTLVNTAFTMF